MYALISSATHLRNDFMPMSYLKYIARDFQRSLGNLEIEQEASTTPDQILDDVRVNVIQIANGLGKAGERTTEQQK